MEVKAPKQADHEAQKAQQELILDKSTEVELSDGRKVKIGLLHNYTCDKIDDIIVEHDEIAKMVEEGKMPINKANRKTRQHFAKIAAAILLNEKTKIILFWWIKWRIIYYRWNITADDYLKIMAEAKKKGQAREYLVAMAFSMTMTDIWTMMTKKEAEAFLRELNSANAQQQ